MQFTQRKILNAIVSGSFIASLMTPIGALAEECKAVNRLQLNGTSYHFNRVGYNERNYGIGFERASDCGSIDLGFSLGYYRNSFDRDSLYGLGTLNLNHLAVRAGNWRGAPYAAVGLTTNYPDWVGGTGSSTKLVGLLGASLRHSSGWGGNIGLVPHRDGVVMFNLTREF